PKNCNKNSSQKTTDTFKTRFPPQQSASQLKILIPVGTEITIVEKTKKVFPAGPMPTVNIWCAHTLKLIKPIATDAATIAGYPKIALREKTGRISLTKPNAGNTRM